MGLFAGGDAGITKLHVDVLPQPGMALGYQEIVFGRALVKIRSTLSAIFWGMAVLPKTHPFWDMATCI